MCNLSEGVWNNGIRKGKSIGLKEGGTLCNSPCGFTHK